MRRVLLVAALALAMTGKAQAHGQWNVERVRVAPGEAATLHSPALPRQALVQTWVRVNGQPARAVIAGRHLIFYRVPGVDIIQRTGRAVRWRISNQTRAGIRVSVGWQRFR